MKERMWETLHFTTNCNMEAVDMITRIFGETEEVYGKILYYFEGYTDFAEYLEEQYGVDFQNTEEVQKLFRKMARIKKSREMSFEDGYKEGVRAAKREIVDTLSEQLHGSRDNIPIEDMQLSVRTFNILKRAGINTLSDILREKKEGLKRAKLGRNGYNEVVEILVARYGQERSEWTFDEESN